jgi:endonuclease/exonuclease/phosphatase family metal-dependent hydrolase
VIELPAVRAARRTAGWPFTVSRAFRVAVIALALTAGGIFWIGSDRQSSGPAAGERLLGSLRAASPRPLTIRVGSFNIHSGVGPDGRLDLHRTADALNSLDLIALNEVRGPDFRGNPDQAEQLGQALGLRWLFAPTERQWWRDHFGNGVLTSLPVTNWLRIPLPCSRGKGYRNALLVTIETGDRPLHVLITHLDRTDDRADQLRVVSDLFLSLQEPALLLGDLNTSTADPQLQKLCAAPDVIDVIATNPASNLPRRIDWILARGLQPLAAATWDAGASDHPLVWAELTTGEIRNRARERPPAGASLRPQ